ncbi:hypothetical protein LUZ63_008954 [Rhynchospora breviuscula]|uniref:Ubiquitin carboxyl-terminal hydrolase n=1 Tax=Rhynchospora breviuscula TaxID=2022672 RepID=A0A9Q0CE68_9POAL|nr:hypothetical protein LUZ63_008954 [Rhynchospora breviuscula]
MCSWALKYVSFFFFLTYFKSGQVTQTQSQGETLCSLYVYSTCLPHFASPPAPIMTAPHEYEMLFGDFTQAETNKFQAQPTSQPAPPIKDEPFTFGSLQFPSIALVQTPCLNNQSISPVKPAVNHNNTTINGTISINNFKLSTNVHANGTPKSSIPSANGAPCKFDIPVNINEGQKEVLPKVQNNGVEIVNGDAPFYEPKLVVTPKNEKKESKELLTERQEKGVKVEIGAIKHNITSVVPTNEKKPRPTTLLPRGLVNTGNMCFLNASLQALLSCSPFVELLQDLRDRVIPKVAYPTLSAFVDFISNFDMPEDSGTKLNGKGGIECGSSLKAVMFDPVLRSFSPNLPIGVSARPRQEDAQEFLSFVMDQMHNELLKLKSGSLNSAGGNMSLLALSEDDEGWETVGPKNKSAVTRTQTFVPSELSAIFGGQLRSVVTASGNKPSATVQPFLLLHLDIFPDIIHTIEDALRFFSAPETLEGYRTASGKEGVVTARKSVNLQALPAIMILHLMRFSYGGHGSNKLHKRVQFPLELVLGRDLVISPSERRRYELVATITHHGREPSKGHYTADTRYRNGQWLRGSGESQSRPSNPLQDSCKSVRVMSRWSD